MISMLIVLILIGVLLNFMPMDSRVKSICVAVVAVVAVIVLIQMFTGHAILDTH